MKKEQKINLEEEGTIVEQQVESTPETKKSGMWKSVVIGGVPGVILGTAGTAFAQEVIDANSQGETNEEESEAQVNPVEPQEINVEMAESVNDDMSFGEAFAAAREEVGPGGVFEWHGNVYNTYTAAEWEAMSDEERQEFANGISGARDDAADDDPGKEVQVSETGDETIDVQIQEVGTVTTEEGEIVNVAVASVDGHDAAFIDADNDGYVDGILVDANDDGIIEENEVIETPDSDMSMSYLAMMAESPEDDMYSGTPDYTNDADTSSLA